MLRRACGNRVGCPGDLLLQQLGSQSRGTSVSEGGAPRSSGPSRVAGTSLAAAPIGTARQVRPPRVTLVTGGAAPSRSALAVASTASPRLRSWTAVHTWNPDHARAYRESSAPPCRAVSGIHGAIAESIHATRRPRNAQLTADSILHTHSRRGLALQPGTCTHARPSWSTARRTWMRGEPRPGGGPRGARNQSFLFSTMIEVERYATLQAPPHSCPSAWSFFRTRLILRGLTWSSSMIGRFDSPASSMSAI